MIGMTAFRAISHEFACLTARHDGSGNTTVSVDRLHMPSALDSLRGLPIPRQQLVESIDRISVDHALEHVAQVGVGLDAVHLARFDQRAECRPSFSAEIRTREEMILAPECNRTDCALNWVGIKLDATVVQESREAVPARQRIADRIGKPAATRRAAELLLEPDLQLFDQRLRERPSLGHPQRRRQAANAVLDGVELAYPPQRFGCDGRVRCFEELIEITPHMHPAGGQDDIAARKQSREAGVAVDVENSREVFQMRRRSLALAIGREHEDRCRRCRAAPRSLVACVHPKPSSLGATATGIEHWDRRIVVKQMIRRKDIRTESFVQRVEPPACAADPCGQRRAIEINAETRKDLRLPVQRRVIAIFADQDLREQRRRRQAACNRALRSRRLRHRSASAAAIFGAANADDTKLRRHPIQHLADAFADRVQLTATASADRRADLDPDLFTRQMIGERLAPRLSVIRSGPRLLLGFSARFVGLNFLQSKRKLIGIDALGPAPKLRALKLLDDQLESFDLVVAVLDNRCHVAHEPMQQSRIGWKIVEIELHDESYARTLIRSSNFVIFHAGFRIFSARERGLPRALRRAPVDAFDQHRELRRRKRYRAARLAQRGPDEVALLQSLGEETQPIAVPEQNFHRVCLSAAEGKQMTRERVLLEHCLHQDGQAVEALPHVGVTQRQMNLHARRNDQHPVCSSCCAMYRRTASGSLPGGANTRRPSASSTATASGGIGNMSCRNIVSAPPSPWLWHRSSAIRTAASVVGLPLPKPNWTRQRKIMLVAMLCRR